MAGYNAWCNRRVYEAVARLSDAEYRADCGAFFKSVHGTLNHLIATDRIWLRRFTGEGEAPSRLDAILFETFATLAPAREAEDSRILSYANGLTEEDLGRRFRYRRVSEPDEIEEPLAPTLFHLFNHQTHHRGQVHGLLTHLGHGAPSLDLIQFVREREQSPS
ncbi:DinB family protein [Microvirga antarctica]|uniref:DinB family protein n=1 Tax=Microvirga antarctica TaxID=2819233 RepID=UPI001FE3D75F